VAYSRFNELRAKFKPGYLERYSIAPTQVQLTWRIILQFQLQLFAFALIRQLFTIISSRYQCSGHNNQLH